MTYSKFSKFPRRSLVLTIVLAGLVLWLGSSALVVWKFTRRSGPAVLEPPPQIAWAKVEAQRLKTDDDQEVGAWLVRGEPCLASSATNGSR